MSRRSTEQRRAIRDVFDNTDRPLSTQEVLAIAQSVKRTIGIATVYRTLRLLIDEGALRTVILPGQPPRYERADKPHHHHFHCHVCDRVFEVPGCPEMLERLVPDGFGLENHDLTLGGRCRECMVRTAAVG